jgi:hypothetical protein
MLLKDSPAKARAKANAWFLHDKYCEMRFLIFTGSFVVVGEADLWWDYADLFGRRCRCFFLINVSVRVSMRASRLISRVLKLTTI